MRWVVFLFSLISVIQIENLNEKYFYFLEAINSLGSNIKKIIYFQSFCLEFRGFENWQLGQVLIKFMLFCKNSGLQKSDSMFVVDSFFLSLINLTIMF